jgi:hypothetical protein
VSEKCKPAKRARVHRWLDTKNMEARFGVQVLSGRKWLHLAIAGEAALYDTAEAAQRQADQIMLKSGGQL